jgi:hypothetical protein
MRRLATLLASALLLAACGGGDDQAADGSANGDGSRDAASDTTAPLDDSPFCVAVRAMEELGSESPSGEATPEQVLAESEKTISLIDEAAANVPDDAPADVQALFDDYRVLLEAIDAADGDADAAFEALSERQPELMARIAEANAHLDAFTFFSERCGTAAP